MLENNRFFVLENNRFSVLENNRFSVLENNRCPKGRCRFSSSYRMNMLLDHLTSLQHISAMRATS